MPAVSTARVGTHLLHSPALLNDPLYFHLSLLQHFTVELTAAMATEHQPDTERRYSIAVVGGGIGGLCTVIGLLQQGVDVEIYEGELAFTLNRWLPTC